MSFCPQSAILPALWPRIVLATKSHEIIIGEWFGAYKAAFEITMESRQRLVVRRCLAGLSGARLFRADG